MSSPAPRSPRTIIHQLRSPVTAIIGFADTLARSAERGTLPSERLIDRLARIRTSAEQINALLDELDSHTASPSSPSDTPPTIVP